MVFFFFFFFFFFTDETIQACKYKSMILYCVESRVGKRNEKKVHWEDREKRLKPLDRHAILFFPFFLITPHESRFSYFVYLYQSL